MNGNLCRHIHAVYPSTQDNHNHPCAVGLKGNLHALKKKTTSCPQLSLITVQQKHKSGTTGSTQTFRVSEDSIAS